MTDAHAQNLARAFGVRLRGVRLRGAPDRTEGQADKSDAGASRNYGLDIHYPTRQPAS